MMLETADTAIAFGQALEGYLAETLHAPVRVKGVRAPAKLPRFVTGLYDFYEATILDRRCIVMVGRADGATPTDIAKHVGLVGAALDALVVYGAEALTSRQRSRMVELGVPFVVPGNQLYVPQLAMDLREHFRAPRPRSADGLSPVAQAVLFHHLLRLDEAAATPSALAKRLGYTAMSAGRAFDELAGAGLATADKRGRERRLRFRRDRRALLEKAKPLLRSPVRSVKRVQSGRAEPPLKLAGETALAELTDLAPPRIATFATTAGSWRELADAHGWREVEADESAFHVETWSYDPAKLSEGPTVDPLSLYVIFRDHREERVQAAAEQLLERVPW